MAERITDRLVKGLAPPEKGNRIVYDEKVKGFGIRVTKAGARAFVLNYRNGEGRECRYTIGTYGPDQWSVEAARRRAGDLKKQISLGADPVGEKVKARTAPTVEHHVSRPGPRRPFFKRPSPS